MLKEPIKIAVLVSGHGRGTNLQALIDACADGRINGKIAFVIGTRSDAPALERAKAANIYTSIVSPKKYENDSDGYSATLMRILEREKIDLICLCGYMLKLPEKVVEKFPDAILNVHPALLPLFGGQGMFGEHVHRAAIESGMKFSGCTVHFVDDRYDNGPIILQRTVEILDEDTPATLSARVLPLEHEVYVEAVKLFAEHRVYVDAGRVKILPEKRDNCSLSERGYQ